MSSARHGTARAPENLDTGLLLIHFKAPWRKAPGVTEPSSVDTQTADPDSGLLERIAKGDHAAYALFVDRHLDRLLAFVQRTLVSRDDAEDVVQEAFLKVWTHANRWQDRGTKASTWLHQIALNLCRDRWRKERGNTVELDENLRSDGTEPEQQLLEDDQALRVHTALQQLPDRQRVAVVLTHFQGMTNPEAAVILSCSVEAMESLLSRARRTLRHTLLDEQHTRKELP